MPEADLERVTVSMSAVEFISTLGVAIERVGGWLDRRRKNQERADAAVKAILLAVNETKAYIADWNRGHRVRDRERLLVQFRTDAAVSLRRYDKEFAQLLQMKAEYWADPENWNDADVARAGIGIEAVAGKARSLLGGGI
jgi:hypothetical protein